MSTPIVPGNDQYWPPVPTPAVAPPQRRALWPWLVLAVAIVFLAGVSWVIYDQVIREDSGVAACKAMRDNAKTAPAKNSAQMTEAEYKQLRGQFEDSRYGDIRDHGTKLVDVVWQMSKLGADPGLGALAYMGPLMTQATALQSACADRGVIVDMNLAGNASGAPGAAPTAAATPKCSEVFQPGKVIDEEKALAGCVDASGGMQFIGNSDCADGRHLFSIIGAETGARPGWGYGGGKYRESADAAGDPGYSKAYQSCTG